MARETEAGRGRFRRWTESDSRAVAQRLVRRARQARPELEHHARVEAPHTRANQPCFYDNGGTPGVVVASDQGAIPNSPRSPRALPELRITERLTTQGVRIERGTFRHRNGHRVERWLLATAEQYTALRDWQRSKQARQRADAAAPRVRTRTTHREFDRKPILSTQLEPGVTIRCTSYGAFEREVARRGKQIPDGGIR